MLKRKYGDHHGWKRVLKKSFTKTFFHTNEFNGHASLIHIQEVSEPLSKTYGNKEICIVDNGYSWLHHYPTNEYHSVTTMFNSNGEIVQWYIDICLQNGVEDGVPWMDDLFLDIVVLPSGEIMLLDTDELEEAFEQGVISEYQYNLAHKEAREIIELVHKDEFNLIKLANEHKKILAQELK
ncbi:DUF402 domain-containing protein [Halalkalibacillus halophilus]|uniref:DUF402 domain-containing protein n=1 Tax=Halalkalibacillus halophilus TaxID=392827 RepID=UPI000400C726|nr:DUF402 domain-containing protein [Halalkalibacillus halophilus]